MTYRVVAPPPTPVLARYAEQLQLASEAVIGACHDEGPADVAEAIRVALTIQPPTGYDPVTSLVTVLAAQVDPEATLSRRLGWVTAGPRTSPVRPDLPVVDRPEPRRLTDSDIDRIRSYRGSGRRLAAEYGRSPSYVSAVRTGKVLADRGTVPPAAPQPRGLRGAHLRSVHAQPVGGNDTEPLTQGVA